MRESKRATGLRVQCYVSEKAKCILQEQRLRHKNLSLTALVERMILNADCKSQCTPPKLTQTYFTSIVKSIKPNEHLYMQMNANASNLNQMMRHANMAMKKSQLLEPLFWEQTFNLLAKMDEDIWHLRKLLLELLSQVYTDIGEKEKARVFKRSLKNYGEYRSALVPNKPKAKN
ncbi:hypothetical protein ACFOPX_06110 [Helicobacter baculiformis]|uniref:Plasmid mobilization relaxosome protein MobC n=1 Tax=Helicobacter baculiformis TaxID=427351 RepID=A0ABV7ZIV7_9HELI|nr:hypothetical protein [Helicobacter baculiformis]